LKAPPEREVAMTVMSGPRSLGFVFDRPGAPEGFALELKLGNVTTLLLPPLTETPGIAGEPPVPVPAPPGPG